MSDSEYESEDDEDYAPEEPDSEEEEIEIQRKRKQPKNKQIGPSKRKKKGGIQLEDEEDPSEDDESDKAVSDDEAVVQEQQETEKQKEASKSRVDDLWAAFKRDTAVLKPSKTETNTEDIGNKDLKNKPVSIASRSVIPKELHVPKKVEITEIFDFAGEKVKVVKSVDASSLEATSKAEKLEPKDDSNKKPTHTVMKKKSTGGLGSILGKLAKNPKLSTLEKSKLDWNQFKKQEGIEDELKTSNKDGYLEKTAFLSRVDHKQFAIERDIRQGARKR